ncbi:MAG: aminotransferase class V-fold PLP-dependent enzyme [Candidatus Micrarchaeia archaeon]
MIPIRKASPPLLPNGFIDVPRIVSSGHANRFFPGLLPHIDEIRGREFPLFGKHGRVYLDSGATSQEPRSVMERMFEYRLSHLRGSNHSVHSAEARQAQEDYEGAKAKLRSFFHANDYGIAFTSGTTGSSNLLATRFNYDGISLVLATEAEHNSQIVTARNCADAAGVGFNLVPVLRDGSVDFDEFNYILKKSTGRILFNLVHASNVTGAINNVEKIRQIAGDRVLIYLDMAQSAGHIPIDLGELGVDFAGVSAHKMYGPTGIGALFVRERENWRVGNLVSGGGAVKLVSRNATAYADSPERFEPGTQNLEGAVEWGFAIDYLSAVGMVQIAAHDAELGRYFDQELAKIDHINIYSPAAREGRVPIFVFNSHYLKYGRFASELDAKGISVRDGCFCAHLVMSQLLGKPSYILDEIASELAKFGGDANFLPGAVRVSFAFYNNLMDAYRAIMAIKEIND